MERGQAEPPITTRCKWGSPSPEPRRWSSRPAHTVGTAAVMVTRPASSISWIEAPSMPGPGSTRPAPVIGPEKAVDQPLAWKKGTTGMSRSRLLRLRKSGMAAAMACSTLERCE